VVKKVLLELEPFKNDVVFLKERENSMSQELSAIIGGNLEMGMHASLSQRGLHNNAEGILNKLSMLEQEIIDVKNIYRIPV
jgi:hypothetical protein